MRGSPSLLVLGISAVLCVAAPAKGRAVEYSIGLYPLGSGAVGAGQTPPAGVYFTTAIDYTRFQSATVPFGGLDLSAKAAFAPGVIGNLLWVLPEPVLGGHLSMSVTSGLDQTIVDASVVGPAASAERSVQGWGVTDTTLRLSLGWDVNSALSDKISVSQWAPTGRYEPGFFPINGLNRPGTDFSWGATYIDPTYKIELSGTVGFTIEGFNPATDYRSGDAVHFEEGLLKHLDNGVQFGVISYQYVQVTPDTGSGAILGPFETRAVAVGPTVGYTTLINGHIVSFTLQAAQEVAVQNRLRQTSGLFSATYKF
jgi:hypothetical protein